MSRTLCAVFDTPFAAEAARRELATLGIPERSILLLGGGHGEAQPESLHNQQDEALAGYQAVARDGGSVAVVHRISPELAVATLDVIARHDAVRFDGHPADGPLGRCADRAAEAADVAQHTVQSERKAGQG